MGLSRAALIAGNRPARMPTSTLKPKASASAATVTIGALSVGENELMQVDQAEGGDQPGQRRRGWR